MKRILAVGVFDLLHAGHLHYLEQAKSLGDHLTVVVAHDDTVRKRKHEPVTNQDLRRRMVAGLKPVDEVVVGNPPEVPIFDILPHIQPNVIALATTKNTPRTTFAKHCTSEATATLKWFVLRA